MELSSYSFTLIQQSCSPSRDFCQGLLEKKVLPEEVVEEDVVVDVEEEEVVVEVGSQELKIQNVVGFLVWGRLFGFFGWWGFMFCGKATVEYFNINSPIAQKNVMHISV